MNFSIANRSVAGDIEQLKLVVIGHVDHGKSTLIGRLLFETGSLPDGKVEELKRISSKRGMPLEWSFVLDAFQAERDQAVTIDTTQIWLRTPGRNTVIIDAPGHREFLKNMISGAANADAAILVVDAIEGMKDQTRRHAYLLKLLGIRQIAVVANKMDLARDPETKFHQIERDISQYLSELGLSAVAIIPISARDGDNLVSRSDRFSFAASPSLIEVINSFVAARPADDQPLRFVVQDVYKFDERRIIVGRVRSGTISVGDTILFSPSDRIGRVASIEAFGRNSSATVACAEEAIGIVLDEQIFVERGDVASHSDTAPAITEAFGATLFWLSPKPLNVGDQFKIKLGSTEASAEVRAIERIIDLDHLGTPAGTNVQRNDLAQVVIHTSKLLAVDATANTLALGRFVLADGLDIVAGGIVNLKGYPDRRRSRQVRASNVTKMDHIVTVDARAARNGHNGCVIWLTGLSGAGKSTLALGAEQILFARGFQTYALDGDNLRHGLNVDLGFSPEERAENIRRVGEVAALFADAGLIVLTAFISPYESDRARARSAAGNKFHEVYVKAPLETCERRDDKGLYRRARLGEIQEFTGISAPYERPIAPELVIDTEAEGTERCLRQLTDYIVKATKL
jgi:bifunctional enzyme CysN/CysC